MSQNVKTPMIISQSQQYCSDAEVALFNQCFLELVPACSKLNVYEATFRLRDMESMQGKGVDGFRLMMQRYVIYGLEQWWGIFVHGPKKTKIVGAMMEDKNAKEQK